jgi:hypothetical protein
MGQILDQIYTIVEDKAEHTLRRLKETLDNTGSRLS